MSYLWVIPEVAHQISARRFCQNARVQRRRKARGSKILLLLLPDGQRKLVTDVNINSKILIVHEVHWDPFKRAVQLDAHDSLFWFAKLHNSVSAVQVRQRPENTIHALDTANGHLHSFAVPFFDPNSSKQTSFAININLGSVGIEPSDVLPFYFNYILSQLSD